MKSAVVLVVLDGWGIGKFDESNPIYIAKPQYVDYLRKYFPSGSLQASGIAIGLPWGEPGNSEVGHLTIGAGKVLYQHYPKITMAIDDGSFFENSELRRAFIHAREHKSVVRLVGLATDGNVHASLKHILALIEMSAREKIPCTLHLITDGRDSLPKSAPEILKRIGDALKKTGADSGGPPVGAIVSIMGRFYGMDRDGHLDRVERAYKALLGDAPVAASIEEALTASYATEKTDEFVEPVTIGAPHPIQSNDAVIFFNFREDRMREITEPFLSSAFTGFPIIPRENLCVITMTQYHDWQKTGIAFPNDTIEYPLGRVLAENGKSQLRIAETEKYAHVTYFFNGLREEPYANEFRVIIPSQKTANHAMHPEMRAKEITDRALAALQDNTFDFILINYANPDMVAHTGDFEATVRAIKKTDEELGRLIRAVLDNSHTMIITSDHGNAEALLDERSGEPQTIHDPNPVPVYLVGRASALPADRAATDPYAEIPVIGILADIAPTILELMDIAKPADMNGESLLPQLRRL